MGEKVKKIAENYINEQSKKKKNMIMLMVLSLFVVTGVFWSLKLNGVAQAGDALCGIEEHKHNDECYESVLICELEENEEHTHTEECYEKRLKCEKEEHVHIDMCYADIKADLENKSVWEATLPSLSHDWSKDMVAVATSQLGYQESEKNFKMSEDGTTRKGYSRYGEWYGNKYGDWNEMFVAFCLNYADISQEIIPSKASSQELINLLQSKDLFKTDDCQSGDIIFFNDQRMGIVVEAGNQIQVIEGDYENKVQKVTYALNDETIKGYANIQKADELAQEAKISTLQATIYADNSYQQESEDSTKITVAGHLPEGMIVKAVPTAMNVEGYMTVLSYEISMFNEDGTKYVPSENVEVSILSSSINSSESLLVHNGSEFIDANISESAIQFETKAVSKVAVLKAVVQTFAGNQVANETELKAAINGDESEIQLIANFTVNQAITLTNKNITLDLNGHTLTTSGTLFNVPNGSQLTIKDSQAKAETTKEQTGDVYGHTGSYTENNLTYYVTESSVSNTLTGATTEKLVEHTVPLSGRINAGNAPVINLTGGTVNLESGMIYDGTNRAFNMSGGTLNLKGGYIFGFKKTGGVGTGDTNFGGAVLATGGTTNISGTVLTANEALNGGAFYIKNATVNMTGGIISGNTSTRVGGDWGNHSEGGAYRCGGGGFFMNGASTLTMSGGYITNNKANDEAYFDGGGAILYSETSQLEVTNGYITGNEAAGGGAIRSDWNKGTKFTMTGGYVSANVARSAEGGGIAITQGGVGYIKGGYITNNKIIKTGHWGGGGVFCSDGSSLFINDVLVTDNAAGGFGGGVAGCSTGRVYVTVKNGGAIYENTAQGLNLSGGGSQKNEDHAYAASSPVFMENGFQDYFCALNSLVEGGMLGDGTANWKGSLDGVPVTSTNKKDVLEAAYVMGLTAYPSDLDKTKAQSAAKLYINGNSSYTHGGGILCNGYLIIGDKNPISVGSRFSLSGTKKLLNENGSNSSLNGYAFKFSVKDEHGNIVSIGTSDKDGKIDFDRLLSFSEELCSTKITSAGQSADFVYYLSEDTKQENTNIQTDTTQYKITVTITRKDENLSIVDANGKEITKVYYEITGVNVERSTDQGQSWSNVPHTWTPSKDEQHSGSLTITKDGTTFTNKKKKVISYTVHKKWLGIDGIDLPESVTVDLLRNGEVFDTVVLNAGNNWSYTWNNLADGYTYTVKEHPIPGYVSDIVYGSGNVTKRGWVPATSIEDGKNYLIVTQDGFVLNGKPTVDGAYEINGNFTKITIDDGMIAVEDVTENMQWSAVLLRGKNGIYLKNLPSDFKHYLSYQNTDTVKLSSGNTDYASRAEIDNGYLKLYKQGSTTDIKYVVKSGDTLKASENKDGAVRLFVLNDAADENIATITNTKVSHIKIHKVSANDNDVSLAGAIFELYKNNNIIKFRLEENQYIYDPNGEITQLISDENGYINITGLPDDTYVLKEVQAPDGYQLAEDTIFTIDNQNRDVEIIIEDIEILYELPETGGSGTYIFTLIGLLLMVTPLIYKYKFRHKER